MDTVTPPGFTVRFDTSDFARADDLTTAQTDAILIDNGILTPEAAARRRGMDPRDVPAQAPNTTTATSQETARA